MLPNADGQIEESSDDQKYPEKGHLLIIENGYKVDVKISIRRQI